jgi:hypothetical protein
MGGLPLLLINYRFLEAIKVNFQIGTMPVITKSLYRTVFPSNVLPCRNKLRRFSTERLNAVPHPKLGVFCDKNNVFINDDPRRATLSRIDT